MRIDSHLHFWKYEAGKRNWITNEMTQLHKDFLPEAIQPALARQGIDGCVAVQSRNDESENEYLLLLAEANPFIKGIVGWTDLQANDVEQKLVNFSRHTLIKGFRHIVEAADSILLKPTFKRGVELLSKNGFTFDLLADMDQLRYAYQLATQLPNQKFIIDHAGKPPVGKEGMADWKRNISLLGPLQNVYCKIPGISMETAEGAANTETVTPYLDVLVEAFGTDRLLYGSNWPVSVLKTDYQTIFDLTATYLERFSEAEKAKVFGENAVQFYGL